MNSRRKARILAFQGLYFWDAVKAPAEEITRFSWISPEKRTAIDADSLAFSRLLVSGAIEHIGAVDDMIRSHLEHWDFTRLKRVDLAILRMSVYTLLFQPEMHPSIVIDEAIGIACEYGSDDSFRFVNAVLDSIRKAALSGREE